MNHVLYKCPINCQGCMFCEGGLSMCVVCKKAEVELDNPECFGPITLQRRYTDLTEHWNIVYRGVRVGMIVKSLGQYVIVRCKKAGLEIAARKSTFGEAKEFVMSGGQT